MWWNVRSGLSKYATGQIPPKTTSSAEPSSRSTSLDRMIQDISLDLSELADQEQNEVRQELSRRIRDWCVRDISHDLRTPLNAIIGFAQMMENGTLGRVENPQYLEYLRHIRESGYELLDQVEQLMDPPSAQSAEQPAKRFKQRASELEEAVA